MDPIMTDLSAPMSPSQLKAARAAFGWTQKQMADAIGLEGPNRKDTVRAWEYGRNPISGPARTAIRALLLFRAESGGDFTPALAKAILKARETPSTAEVFATEFEPIPHAA